MLNPVKPTIKSEIVPIIVIIITVIASFYFYTHFPERVPTHWNFRGEADGWSSRGVGAFLIPAMLGGMYFLFYLIPFLDPKKERYAQFRKVYHIFKAVIILVLSAIYFIASLNALGYELPVENWVPFAVGLLFVTLGNYLGKIKPNWFMGIRTPWTLSSEEVWNKTHRLGGKAFIISGLLMISMPLWPADWQSGIFIALISIAAVVPVVYSYVLYAKDRSKK